MKDSFGPTRLRQIKGWGDEQLVKQLRSEFRANLGIEDYRLIMAETLARILERVKEPRP